MYKHRIETQEMDNQLTIPVQGSAGLQVIVGTAPINKAEDPYSVTNIPLQVNSFADAQKLLGYSDNFEHYTLCQSMDASFRVFAVAPVIFINVLDPEKHKTTYNNENITVTDKTAAITDEGLLLDKLALNTAAGAELEVNVDYIASFNSSGGIDVTLLSTDKTNGVTALKAAGVQLDASSVTKEDIIGGYDVATGKETGLEVIRQVYPKLGMTPGLILAPGWSQIAEVAAVMASKTEDINGVFTCEAVIDIDSEQNKVYTGLKEAKEEMAIANPHAILLWPKLRIGSKSYFYSAIWAAMTANTDVNNNDVPVKSPSNELLSVSAAVLADGMEIALDTVMAEAVNAYGIVTAINDGGWKAWGNNTSAYPGTVDPKDRWISCRRMMSWYRNHFVLTYKNKVDDPANYRLIESIVDSENLYLNSLASMGDIAGGSISFNEADNPISAIMDGRIVFYTKIAFWTPAEYILNKIEFDPTIIQTALGGA